MTVKKCSGTRRFSPASRTIACERRTRDLNVGRSTGDRMGCVVIEFLQVGDRIESRQPNFMVRFSNRNFRDLSNILPCEMRELQSVFQRKKNSGASLKFRRQITLPERWVHYMCVPFCFVVAPITVLYGYNLT
jgi:hypothetical protein